MVRLGAMFAGNRDGAVCGARVHHHDLMGEVFYRLQRAAECLFLILHDHTNRQARLLG